MARQIRVYIDQDTFCPNPFTQSSGEALGNILAADPCHGFEDAFSYVFRIDLTPLFLVADRNSSASAAWQPVGELIACLHDFLHMLDNFPGIHPFSMVEAMRQQVATCYSRDDTVDDDYFRGGTFQADLSDLLRMAEWARQQGTGQVRLVMQ
jgi:hypothetical protein